MIIKLIKTKIINRIKSCHILNTIKKSGTLLIKNIFNEDTTELASVVIKNQQTIYQPELVESFVIFHHILIISPELCWIAINPTNNHCCAHLIAHPWPNSSYPPVLNRDREYT